MEETIKLLWQAADQRKACRISLSHEPFPRVIHPYGVCQTSRDKIVLVCNQVAGYTKTGRTAGYRNLNLKRIEEVEVLAEHFETPSDFNPSDVQYKEWVFHILEG